MLTTPGNLRLLTKTGEYHSSFWSMRE